MTDQRKDEIEVKKKMNSDFTEVSQPFIGERMVFLKDVLEILKTI